VKTLNPFVPTVPLISVPSRSRRERFKKVVFLVLAAHMALLLGLLMSDYHRDLTIYARELPSGSALAAQAPEALPDPTPASLPPAQASPAPVAKPAAPVLKATVTSAPTRPETFYTVQSGDTLNDIAKKYGTTLKAIKTANNLTAEHLRVSQKLKIP
jgi:nucleoid-associated protein YgaU